MRQIAVITLAALVAGGAAHAQKPGSTFAGLVGSCWVADVELGVTDTHCFTAAATGKAVMDIHKVRDRAGAITYEGVTTYRTEGDGAIRYDYLNSAGDLLSGYARRERDRLVFSEAPGGAPATVWYLGPTAYEVGAGSTSSVRRKFVKAGPAGGSGL
jgi:hypothetical protein